MKKLIVLLALLPIVAFGRGGLVTPTISANGGSGGGSATNISLDASGVVSAPAGQNLVTKFTSNGTNAMVAAAQGVDRQYFTCFFYGKWFFRFNKFCFIEHTGPKSPTCKLGG